MQQLWETILKSAGLEETQFIESLFLVKLFDKNAAAAYHYYLL